MNLFLWGMVAGAVITAAFLVVVGSQRNEPEGLAMRHFLPNRFATDNARVSVAWHMAADGLHREYLAKADAPICQKFFAVGTANFLRIKNEKYLTPTISAKVFI